MPSGPKKRRAARRKRGSGTNSTEEEVEDGVEVCESLNKAEAADQTGSKTVDQIALKSPPTVDQFEKSKDVPAVEECESVGKESLDDAIIMQDPVITKEKEYTESASVVVDDDHDRILVQPDSKETQGNGYADVDENGFHGPPEMVNDVTSSSVVDEVEDNMSKHDQPQVIMVDESVSQVNVQHSPKQPLGRSSFLADDEGECVVESGSVMNEGEDMSMEEAVAGSSSHEPQEIVKTVDLKKIRTKEDDDAPDSVIEVVDAETIISFEDAPDSFETPLGSPSLGYMSPYSVNEVNVQTSFKEPHGSMVDRVSPVEGLVQGNQVAQGGESESHGSPTMVDHVESDMKVNEETSMESGVVEEALEELSPQRSSHELVKTVDQFDLKAMTLEESVVETYSKDSFQEPIGSFGLTDVSQGNGCAVGECTCDCPLVNHVVSEGEKVYLEEPTEHQPQEMVDRSPVESFVQFNGHEDEPIDGSLNEQEEGDVTCVEGIVLGAQVGETACHEEMSIQGVLDKPLENPSGHPLYEQQGIVKTLHQSVLKENQDPCSIQGNSASEENEDTSSKDAQEYSFKVATGSSFWVNVSPINPFVLGMEEDDDDDMSIEGVLEEELIEPFPHELQEMVKAFDQSVLKEMPLYEPVTEVSIHTSLKDTQDSFKDSLGIPSLHKVSFISDNVHLDSYGDEAIERSLYGGQVMMVLKNIPLEEAQDLGDSVIEVNAETSSKDTSSTEGDVQGDRDHGVPVLEDEEMSMEYVLKEPLEELTEISPDELQEMVKKVDLSVVNHYVPVESETEAPLIDTQDSFKEPQESTFLADMSSDEHIVHGKECIEGDESAAMVNLQGSDMKENEEISKEGVLEEHFEDVIGRSSYEPDVMIKTVDQFVMKGVPLKETQDTFLPVTTEVNVETPFKDSQESLKEPLESPSPDDVSVSPLEDVVQGNELVEVGERAYHIVSVVKEGEEMSIEGVVLQDPLKEPIGSSSHELETMVKTDDGEMSMEGVLQDPSEDPSGTSSHEPQEMVKTVDQLDLKGLHLKEAQDPSIPADSVIKVNVDTSFEDAQDYFETPLGSPSVGHVSLLEGFAEWNKQIGDSSHEPHVMVKTVDEVVSKVITMEETQEPSLPVESVIESNVDTPLKDAKDQSSMESLGSFSMADVSSMEDFVQGNECAEVGERSFEGEVVPMEGVSEEPYKEPIKPFSDELQTMVKTVDQSVQDPSIPVESDFEANVETSLKDNQDSFKGVVQEKAYGQGGENSTLVNHAESVKKENEDLSLEGDLDESFKEPNGRSSHEQKPTVNTIDHMPLLKEIPLNEATDSSVPVESFIEVNVETSFKDSQESVPLGTSSQVDVFPVEGIVRSSPVMANDGSSTLVNGSVVEGVGQRNEMVGLVRTLLEEIRRIRAFYEEGLRQTTQIDLQMLQVLEKFDSGQQC